MAAEEDDVVINLRADTNEGVAGIKQIADALGGLGKSAGIAKEFLGGLADGMAQGAKSMGVNFTPAMLAGAAAVGVATYAFAKLTRASIDQAKAFGEWSQQLKNASTQLGVTVQTYQLLQVRLSELGQSATLAVVPLTRLNVLVSQAARGGEQAAATFQQLGINFRDTGGRLKAPEAVLQDVARALFKIQDDSTRAAVAVQLFGRSGTQILPLLKGIAENGLDASKNINVIGERIIDVGVAFDSQTSRISNAIQTLARVFGAFSASALTPLADKMADAIETPLTWIIDHQDQVTSAIEAVGTAMGALADATGAVATGNFGETVAKWLADLSGLSGALDDPRLWKKITEGLATLRAGGLPDMSLPDKDFFVPDNGTVGPPDLLGPREGQNGPGFTQGQQVRLDAATAAIKKSYADRAAARLELAGKDQEAVQVTLRAELDAIEMARAAALKQADDQAIAGKATAEELLTINAEFNSRKETAITQSEIRIEQIQKAASDKAIAEQEAISDKIIAIRKKLADDEEARIKKATEDAIQLAEVQRQLSQEVAAAQAQAFGTPEEQRIQALTAAQDDLIERLGKAGLQGEIENVRIAYAKMIEDAKAGTIDLGKTLNDAVGDAFEGVILGTRKGSDILDGFTASIKQSFAKGFAEALTEKLKFDSKINLNFTKDLPGYASEGVKKIGQLFSGLFDALGGGSGSPGLVTADSTTGAVRIAGGAFSGGGGGGGGLSGGFDNFGRTTGGLAGSGAAPGQFQDAYGSTFSGPGSQEFVNSSGATVPAESSGGGGGMAGGAGLYVALVIAAIQGSIAAAKANKKAKMKFGATDRSVANDTYGGFIGGIAGDDIGNQAAKNPVANYILSAGTLYAGEKLGLFDAPTSGTIARDNVAEIAKKAGIPSPDIAMIEPQQVRDKKTGHINLIPRDSGKGFNAKAIQANPTEEDRQRYVAMGFSDLGLIEDRNRAAATTIPEVFQPGVNEMRFSEGLGIGGLIGKTDKDAISVSNALTSGVGALGLSVKDTRQEFLKFADAAGITLVGGLEKYRAKAIQGDVTTEQLKVEVHGLIKLFTDLPEWLEISADDMAKFIDTARGITTVDVEATVEEIAKLVVVVQQLDEAAGNAVDGALKTLFSKVFTDPREEAERAKQEREDKRQAQYADDVNKARIKALDFNIAQAKALGQEARAAELAMERASLMIPKALAEAAEDLTPIQVFAQSLREGIANAIISGITDAIITAGVVQGALAPVFLAIKNAGAVLGDTASSPEAMAAAMAGINAALQAFDATKVIEFVNSIVSMVQGSGIVDSVLNTGPGIPAMAAGGIVRNSTLAMIGEDGPEAILPLNDTEAMRRVLMGLSDIDLKKLHALTAARSALGALGGVNFDALRTMAIKNQLRSMQTPDLEALRGAHPRDNPGNINIVVNAPLLADRRVAADLARGLGEELLRTMRLNGARGH